VSAGWRALAPGKVNLALFIGAPRASDRLHPLVSVVQPLSLADELTLRAAPAGVREDEVRCPGVEGPNLAGAALAAFRARTGWDAPPQRLEIVKRVPVAAGMGGGSGDAAATLRLAAAASGTDDPELLHELAVGLGADVPSQVSPGRVLMSGAGEHVEPLAEPAPFGLVIVPLDAGLSTPEVYRAFDAGSEPCTEDELEALADELRTTWLAPERIHNDLEDAARGLCGLIDPALEAVRATGAPHALVSGSGPTVFGILPTAEEAVAAARALAPAYPRTVAVEPTGPAFAAPQPLP
jgi:4-diphosphocytidyl-2-C-methyl-D-erythritol kinase